MNDSARKPMVVGEDQILISLMQLADNVGRMTAVGVETGGKIDKIVDSQNALTLKFAIFEVHLKQIQDDFKEMKADILKHDGQLQKLTGLVEKISADMYGDPTRKDSSGIFQFYETAREEGWEQQGVKKWRASTWATLIGSMGLLSVIFNYLVRRYLG